ncbi:MAG: hypothetical protein A2X42_02220 [Candidatus Margulisbacteria bacterium GWF2_38_17]|nr:MAG: hypothetical protein A2X43_09545 [Candidatus Margulisbacteria bacterium GWD2_39_127]OGI02867.1 MAG: hypothetical protein A2X42_02220 [Candidatus Margulisbacteria bacterium GWF2_38_17]OGI09648.1 MAG: hypothetical protein A2X41_04930 [Candidatus Margulisbacteria bacterium GWE2_39_32]
MIEKDKANIFELLRKDHQEIRRTLANLTGLNELAWKARQEAFSKLQRQLLLHMRLEEKEFYSAFIDNHMSYFEVLKSLEEHHIADILLNELDIKPVDSDSWKAKLLVLKNIIERHMQVEENRLFEIALNILSNQKIYLIGKKFVEKKEKAEEHGLAAA